MNLPRIKYMKGVGGRFVGRTATKQNRHPTYAEAQAILSAAASRPCRLVQWFWENDNALGVQCCTITICECGETALNFETCATCQLIGALVTDRYQRGPQVQYERAERAMQRLADVAAGLERKAKGEAA